MNPALETLILAFSSEENGLPIPRQTLFLGAEMHEELRKWPCITGWQPKKFLADPWDAAGFLRVDDIDEIYQTKWSTVLLLPGKSKDETLFWFAIARKALAPGGQIVVSMPNTAGAGRFEKEFSKATGGVSSIQKHKCRAFYAQENEMWNEDRFLQWEALGQLKKIRDVEFVTCAGVFSCDHIDPGSQFLEHHLPGNLWGNVADLGAGWGFLSDAILQKCKGVETLDLYEADARALNCARKNLQNYEREINFHWHDVTRGLLEIYDSIVMNPPFHTGQAMDIDLGNEFITNATAALRKGGRMFLVANRQLPYEPLLEKLKLSWRKVAENQTYKILFADKR